MRTTDSDRSFTNGLMRNRSSRFLSMPTRSGRLDKDGFDRDYQKVRKGKEYLEKKSYSNAAFLSRYNSIKYNNAANDLDPRF